MARLSVQIWSDIACPWCHVGKRRFEAALARFEHADEVDVTWRSFELDPAAPRTSDPAVSYAERLARKYGAPLDQAEGMIRTMTETAAAEGLDFHFERIRPGNTFDAHRLLHLAKEQGRGDAVKERFLTGYLSEGVAIGDPDALHALAVEAGFDEAEARAILAGGAFVDEVRADEREATALGVSAVPHFRIGDEPGISGAHAPEVLLAALRRAWSSLERAQMAGTESDAQPAQGGACGPTGCE